MEAEPTATGEHGLFDPRCPSSPTVRTWQNSHQRSSSHIRRRRSSVSSTRPCKFLLGTPLAGPARKQMMVRRASRGARPGVRTQFRVSAQHIDNQLYALTGAPWTNNFRDGAAAEVLHDGTKTPMRGELITDPAVVAELSHRCAESYGVKRAQRMMGLGFRDQRIPTLEEFKEAAQRDHWSPSS